MKTKLWVIFLALALIPSYMMYTKHIEESKREELVKIKNYVRASVSQKLTGESALPEKLQYDDLELKINYSVDENFQKEVTQLLKRYPSDHTSIVVMDNKTGNLLAFGAIDRETRELNYTLPFTSTHPSASLFKIVTTADLLENANIDPDTRFHYRGRGTTLYKYQLKNKINRWTRWISFRKAFAYSNNVIFGKAAINKSNGQSIFKTAFKFGFNKQLMNDFNLGPSQFVMPESQYQLAELASGFNKKTLISPVHASVLASVVANKGVLRKPRLIESIDHPEGKIRFDYEEEKILSDSSIKDLAAMMQFTVKKGTARGVMRGRLGRKLKQNLVVGAKTGSITGGTPYGKHDWMSFFARPKEGTEYYKKDKEGISVAILNINGKKWYYKSSFLAQRVLEIYLRNLKERKEVKLTVANQNSNNKGS